ncbi:MAG: hypothetical protein KDC05_06270 [Bacteroidales bacterium]|nr:hypothetical protein [Bacteroidales bacterium]
MAEGKKYIVKQLGSFDETKQVIKFSWKLPSYCKALTGVTLFSPELIQNSAANLNAELSIWLNNQNTPVGNYLFTLGYHQSDDQQSRMFDVNQELIKGKEITGFVKYLVGALPFNIHLILECKL